MIEGQLLRRDDQSFSTLFPVSAEVRAEQLRKHLTPAELRSFGIVPPYDEHEPVRLPAERVLSSLGAVLSTTMLFLAVGYLATLGLPDPAYAIASVPANLA